MKLAASVFSIFVVGVLHAAGGGDTAVVTSEYFVIYCDAADLEAKRISEADAKRASELFESLRKRYADLGLKTAKDGAWSMLERKQTFVYIYDWRDTIRGRANLEREARAFASGTREIHMQLKDWGNPALFKTAMTKDDVAFVAAHELFHCIQHQYVGESPPKHHKWMMEATATWAAAELFPSTASEQWLKHARQYLAEQHLAVNRGKAELGGPVGDAYATAILFRYFSKSRGPTLLKPFMEAWVAEIENPPAEYEPLSVLRTALGMNLADFREMHDRFALACAAGAMAQDALPQAEKIGHAPWLPGLIVDSNRVFPGTGPDELKLKRRIGQGGFQSYYFCHMPADTASKLASPTLYIEVPSSRNDLGVQAFWKSPREGVKFTKAVYDAERKRYLVRIPEFGTAQELDPNVAGSHAVLVVSRHGAGEAEYPLSLMLGDPPAVREVKVTQKKLAQHLRWDDERPRDGFVSARSRKAIVQKAVVRSEGPATVEVTFTVPVKEPVITFDKKTIEGMKTANDGLTWKWTVPADAFAGDLHELGVRARTKLMGTAIEFTLDTESLTVAKPMADRWEHHENLKAEMVIELKGDEPNNLRIVFANERANENTVYSGVGGMTIGSAEQLALTVALAVDAADFPEWMTVHFTIKYAGKTRHQWAYWRGLGRDFNYEPEGQSAWASFLLAYDISGSQDVIIEAEIDGRIATSVVRVTISPAEAKLQAKMLAAAQSERTKNSKDCEERLAHYKSKSPNDYYTKYVEYCENPEAKLKWDLHIAALRGDWNRFKSAADEQKAIYDKCFEMKVHNQAEYENRIKEWERRKEHDRLTMARRLDDIDTLIAFETEIAKNNPANVLGLMELLVRAGQRDAAVALWQKQIEDEIGLQKTEQDKQSMRRSKLAYPPPFVPRDIINQLKKK